MKPNISEARVEKFWRDLRVVVRRYDLEAKVAVDLIRRLATQIEVEAEE